MKTRFVCKGYSQTPGVDVFDTFAPVAGASTIRLFCSTAANWKWEVEFADVETAFLFASLRDDEEIFVEAPADLIGDGNVLKLNKALYGLRQSPRRWNQCLVDFMVSDLGYEQCKADPCLLIKRSEEGELLGMVVLWVDDIACAGSKELIDSTFEALDEKYKLKRLGADVDQFVGVQYHYDRDNGYISLHQRSYTESMLEKFGAREGRIYTTPGVPGYGLTKDMEASTMEEQAELRRRGYGTAVGCLMWLANFTRPDLACAVRELSRFLLNPGLKHWEAVERVFGYLRGTLDYKLCYGSGELKLEAYADASYASDVDTRCSTTGFVIMYGGAAIMWGSRQQSTVALSSTEAEYMALSDCLKEVLYHRSLLSFIFPEYVDETSVMFEDNEGCIKLAYNNASTKRLKHIDVRYHFIQEHVVDGHVELRYIPTKDQLADCLTKHVCGAILSRLVKKIMGFEQVTDCSSCTIPSREGVAMYEDRS
jgi:hypothetical protein